MKICIGSYLRSVVSRLVGIDVDEPEDKVVVEVDSKTTSESSPGPKAGRHNSGSDLKDKQYKAPPKIKPPRRKTTPTEWDFKGKRTEYMQEYRSEGKDLETGNRYIKKFKGESHA
jgi:hypothetical protein